MSRQKIGCGEGCPADLSFRPAKKPPEKHRLEDLGGRRLLGHETQLQLVDDPVDGLIMNPPGLESHEPANIPKQKAFSERTLPKTDNKG